MQEANQGGWGAVAGIGVVCLSALLLGPPGSPLAELDHLQSRLVAVRPVSTRAQANAPDHLFSFVLFGAGSPVAVTLQGVSIEPGRRAALVSLDGAASDWLDLGETRDGVTLVDVQPSKITVDTDVGTKEVEFGQGGSVAGSAPPAAPVQTQAPAGLFNGSPPSSQSTSNSTPSAGAPIPGPPASPGSLGRPPGRTVRGAFASPTHRPDPTGRGSG